MNGYFVLQLILLVLCCYIPYCDAAAYGESCNTTNVCTGNGVVCPTTGDNPGTCGCDPAGYFTNDVDGCIAEVGYGCLENSDCSTSASCTVSVCTCTSNSYDSNGPTIGGTCQPKVAIDSVCSYLVDGASLSETCSDPQATCVSLSGWSCQCNTGYYNNAGTCTPKVDVDATCPSTVSSTAPCSDPQATCVFISGQNKCQCNNDYYNNGGTCTPKVDVDATCPSTVSSTAPCSDPQATCVFISGQNKCQCNNDYYNNGGTCTPKVDVDATCPYTVSSTAPCSDPQATCVFISGQNKCQCNNDYYNNGGTCTPKVDVDATCPYTVSSTAPCSDPQATCVFISGQNKCQCNNDYYNNGGTCTPKVDVDATCPSTVSSTAPCSDPQATCVFISGQNKCQCNNDYYNNGGTCTPKVDVDATCPSTVSSTAPCSDPQATCVFISGQNKCQCNNDYYNNGGTCTPKRDLGQSCSGSIPCSDSNTICSGTCQCATTHYDSDGTGNIGGSCVPKRDLGQSCSGSIPCSDSNTICSGTCQCATTHYDSDGTGNVGGSCVPKRDLGQSCSGSMPCSDSNTICSGTCQCATTHYDSDGTGNVGGSCVPKKILGEFCTDVSQCSDSNTICSTICQCATTHYDSDGNNVGGSCLIKRDLGQSCSGSIPCSDSYTVCSGTCQCDTTHYDSDGTNNVGGYCVLKKEVGANCPDRLGPTASCSDGNAECSLVGVTQTYTCQCKSSHYDDNGGSGGGSCTIKVILGYTGCSKASDVTDSCTDTNAECVSSGGSNVCECRSTHYDDNGSQVAGGVCSLKVDLGSVCPMANACRTDNAVCSGTCKCDSNFYDDNTDAELGGACESKVDLGSVCPMANACRTDNAVCSGTCKCDSNFYDDNTDAELGGACESKVDLGSVCPMANACRTDNAVCSGTCKCDSNFYDDNTDAELGGACESRKSLGAPCWSYTPVINDQCSDLNARCSGGTPGSCSCNTGYHQDDGICKPKNALDEQCDPNSAGECTDINAQCLANPSTTLCTCKTGYYKFSSSNGVKSCQPVSQLQVTSIVFSSVSTSRFTVSWSPPAGKSSYVSKYLVAWRPKDNSVSGSSKDISSPTTSTTVSSSLTSGVAYTVTITSVNNATHSGYEQTTSTSKEQALVPLTPNGYNSVGSALTIGSTNRITVRWAASTGVVRQYVFVMKDGDDVKATLNPTTAEAQPVFSGMKNGYTYNIDITARSQFYDGQNYLSSETYSFTLKTTVIAPTEPLNIECTETNIFDDHILLTWGKPTYPNGDIVQYIVEVYIHPQTTVHQTYNTNSNDTSYDVQNLNPGSFYTFKLKTQNERFISSAGTLTQPFCNTRAKMADAPANLLTTDITSRGWKIEWDKPLNVFSTENLGYVLQLKEETNCVIEQIYRCSDCTGTTFNLNTLMGLCASKRLAEIPKTKQELETTLLFTTIALVPDTVYTVSVTAINNEGRGNAAVVTPKTLEEEPQKPFNVMTSAVTSTTVEVTWSLAGPRPGDTTYTVMVEPVDTAAPTVTRTVHGFTNTSYKVTGLEEFWTYTVKVKVETSKGTNTSDTSSTFKTLAAAPGPVDAFTIKTPDEDYTLLKISWKTPTVLQRNGVINSFKFSHNATELTGLTADLGIPETFIAENLDSTVYEKTVIVQPEDIYMFQVYAVNDDDQQGYVTSKIKMTPAGVPQTPMNVVTSDISSTSVVVSWNIEGPRPGITTYTVMVNPVNTAASAVIQQVYGFDNTSCTVIGLEEFWEYTAKVKMETPVGEETSDVTLVFKTLSAPPGPVDAITFNGPFNGDFTQMQISWKMPTILHRNGVIKDLKIVHNATSRSNIESEESSTFSARQEDFIYSIIVDVIPKRTYSVQVYAINTEDMTGEITKETIVAPSPESENPESSNTSLIIAAVLGSVVLLLVVALVIFIVRYKRLKTKQNGRHHSKPLANTEENARFDNLREVSSPISGDYANNYMELDDTSRVDTYDKIAIGRPDVESSATDTEQYEIPDVPSQNRWK